MWPIVLTAALALNAAPPETLVTKPLPNYAQSGTKIGAVAGGIIGAGLFLLGGAFAEGLCEYDCPDIEAPGYIGLGFLGGLLGAGAGALVGSFFGSTIPREEPAVPEPPPELRHPGDRVSPAPEPRRLPRPDGRTLASITLLGGYADFTERESGDAGVTYHARLLSHRGDWIAFGPEIGHFGTDPGVKFQLTGDVRIGPLDGRGWPYAIADIGWYNWDHYGPSVLGAGAGLGWDRSTRPGSATWGVEARYHWTLQNEDEPGNYAFGEVAATARFNW